MNKNTLFKINNNYPIYLLVLIPFSLVFSIFITEIILITLTIFFLKKNNASLKSLFWTDSVIKLILIFLFRHNNIFII